MAYKPGDPRKAAASRRYYLKNKAKYLAYSRTCQDKYRLIVRRYKDRPCADCGVRYPYYVMDFDHRPGETKLFEIAKVHYHKSIERLETEIAKCDVVCSNCHRFRTHLRRTGSEKGVKPKSEAELSL